MTDSETALFLTKLLPVFVYPLGFTTLVIAIGFLGAIGGHWRIATLSIVGGLVVLWVSSMPVFGYWALSTLERQYPPDPINKTVKADAAIVLGGSIGQPLPPRLEPDLESGADRVLHAARLFRAGKVKRILVTGGNFPAQGIVRPEAELVKELLIEWGVPAEAIEIAGASRNTYENALEIKAMWEKQRFYSALLLTSAAHMPRAMAVFKHAGLPVIASATDFEAFASPNDSVLDWLPDANALAMTTRATKEWIGYYAYALRGYL